MEPFSSIRTDRLELVPATLAMLRNDLNDPPALGRLLRAEIPAAWPPALLDRDVRKTFCRMAEDGSDPYFSCWYWIIGNPSTGERVLIGSGGTTSIPGEPGTVGMGYSVLDDFQGRGYATEAVAALLPEILAQEGVACICAATSPDIPASVRVLEKTGFVYAGTKEGGEGIEEGTLMYIRER